MRQIKLAIARVILATGLSEDQCQELRNKVTDQDFSFFKLNDLHRVEESDGSWTLYYVRPEVLGQYNKEPERFAFELEMPGPKSDLFSADRAEVLSKAKDPRSRLEQILDVVKAVALAGKRECQIGLKKDERMALECAEELLELGYEIRRSHVIDRAIILSW